MYPARIARATTAKTLLRNKPKADKTFSTHKEKFSFPFPFPFADNTGKMAVSVGAMLVVILIIVVSFAHSSCGGTNEEELLPYSPDEGWGPQYRTSEELLRRMNDVEADVARREEGDEQMTARYNTTHDIFLPPSSAQDSTVGPANSTSSFVEHRRLTQRMADGSTLFGNVYFISDPHNHFSIQPPDGVFLHQPVRTCPYQLRSSVFVVHTGLRAPDDG